MSQSTYPMSEQALPAEVSLQSDTWLNRYRNFPVFSRTWFRHRCIAFGGTLFFLFVLLTVISVLVSDNLERFSSWNLPFFVCGISLFLLGQSIAVWVRQKNFSERKEAILISSALVFGLLTSVALGFGTHYAAQYVLAGSKAPQVKQSQREPQSAATLAQSAAEQKLSSQELEAANRRLIEQRKAKERGPTITLILTILGFLPALVVLIYWGSFFDLMVFFRQRKRLVEALHQQELQKAQDARREAELRLSVLVAQVEPHFLFNTLAGVRSAILTEPLRATAIVDHLVDYLRSTIPHMRGDGSSEHGRLSKQLEAANAYLGLMQARIPRLSYTVSTEINDAAFPPLLLISLVENAIKHGAEPKIGPVHIEIDVRYFDDDTEEKLAVSVLDNGVGFGGSTSGSGIGLANIRERLESMYGSRASLVLKARPEGGVAATITLPFLV